MMAVHSPVPSRPWERAQGSEYVKIFVSCASWNWNERITQFHIFIQFQIPYGLQLYAVARTAYVRGDVVSVLDLVR